MTLNPTQATQTQPPHSRQAQPPTATDSKVLSHLEQEKAITIREIATLLNCGFSRAERILNALVIEGYIQRITKTYKGKNSYIYLSKFQERGFKSEEIRTAFKHLLSDGLSHI